ncbi:DUF2975 domain-containing protein [Virgibacillus pantothenticus]|uniref:DUF2975 domain-containing protein n=1 Tax=Virgibacillus pantothenticus TaxID=1473 RepID=UPI001C2365ED|nr:DUF2975 domain-containing protein [Virgibacillus pantothenticus]MBU8568498.1 DUF2975 domain-containing protein [Virgibacillus pantothenticus]MBU8599930.1 DUF2975 domain-containing protein [Virgibacillus pantothenticus]MBU8636628.1 DUF2975 domain-containing protein [Virgibacillus pantothenticus]MBU8642224.1 DUF2975 domain-containing protein [Virgibacillus pantothenticus]MBU8646338.1 DUF2975 domain-containing protein [Virgibacillus pantothenticus]
MKRGAVTALKAAIFAIGIVVLGLCIFALPSLAKSSAEMFPEFAYLRYPVLLGLYLTAVPFFYALYQAMKLLHFIDNRMAFSDLAVYTLVRIKYCASMISILYVIGMIFLLTQNALHPSIAIMGLVFLFSSIVIMLFSAVLQSLFKNALIMRLENELTV